MDPRIEAERIRSVYRHYDTCPTEQIKRDPRNSGNLAISGHRLNRTRQILDSVVITPEGGLNVLDVGCGDGQFLAWLADQGSDRRNLVGVDLLPDRVTLARRTTHATILLGDGRHLPFRSETFHLVSLITVLSSVLDKGLRNQISCEVLRVLKRGGLVLWYDIRRSNPRNPNVVAITRSELQLIFPETEQELESITLLPPIARRLGRLTPVLYPLLARVPILRSHLIGTIRKSRSTGEII